MKEEYTLDDAFDVIGFGPFQFMLLILSGIGFCATTIELILVSLIRQALAQEWPLVDNSALAVASSLTFAGELIGGLVWGGISDRLGRRPTFIGTALVAAVFALAASLAPSFMLFSLARLGLGFAIGGSLSIDFVYFVEFVPAKARGFRITFIILLGICAFFYTAAAGWLYLPHNWRAFVALCGAPYVFLFLGRILWKWESPRFLMINNRTSEAQQVLSDMAAWNKKSLPKGSLAALQNIPPARAWYRTYADVFGTKWMLPTITVSLLFFCQTFGYYGLTVWIRNFAASRGIISLNPCMTFVVIGVAELPGLFLTTLLIERIGRRRILLINFCGACLSTMLLLLVDTSLSYLLVTSLIYFFIVGCWTGIYVSTPELFPTSSRSSAFAIAGAAGKLGGLASPIVFGMMWDKQIPVGVIVSVAAASFGLAAATGLVLIIETAGKNL